MFLQPSDTSLLWADHIFLIISCGGSGRLHAICVSLLITYTSIIYNLSSLFLSTFRDSDFTTIFGNVFQVVTILLLKMFLHSGLYILFCSNVYMGARRNFSGGGANLWGRGQKICEGGPPYFLDKL